MSEEGPSWLANGPTRPKSPNFGNFLYKSMSAPLKQMAFVRRRRPAARRRRPAARRRPVVRRRMPMRRRLMNATEYASCSEVRKLADGQSNQVYGPNVIDLASFTRATSIGQNYQEFRIKMITWTFKPQFDTFTADTNAATALRVPQLLHIIDKRGAITSAPTVLQMEQMGAKSYRFDDRNIRVSYKPSVSLIAVDQPGFAPGVQKVSPWISTNQTVNGPWAPSQIDHRGIWFVLDAGALPGDGTYEYSVDVEVQFQFRKPNFPAVSGVAQPSISLI